MKNIIAACSLVMALGIYGQAATAIAEVKGTAQGSTISGTVMFQEVANDLQVRAMLSGVPAGEHGFHIHEFGSCADSGKAAGSHYNPLSAPHGQILKEGMGHAHAGDFGNIKAGADGTVMFDAVVPGLALLGGGSTVAGRAVILHEKNDDFSQPVGNAGGRIGCGPIVLIGPVAPVAIPAAPSAPKK